MTDAKTGQRYLVPEGVPNIPAETVVEVAAVHEDGRVVVFMLAPAMTFFPERGAMEQVPTPHHLTVESDHFGKFTRTKKMMKPSDVPDVASDTAAPTE